jgi:hypothetical protein
MELAKSLNLVVRLEHLAIVGSDWWDRHLACHSETGKMPVPPILPGATESPAVLDINFENRCSSPTLPF